MKSRNSENEDVKDEGPEEGEVLPVSHLALLVDCVSWCSN